MKTFLVRFFVVLLGIFLSVAGVQAKDIYVSKERGDNQNIGTREAPLKNLEAALKKAQPGDRILVAEGNYTGLRDRGYLEAPQQVILLGGYSPDFARRDILRYPTTVIPGRESGESGRKPLLSILKVPPGSVFVLDGFIFDRGEQNAYSAKESVIEGLGGRLLRATERPPDGPATVEEPLVCFSNKVNAKVEGDLVIRNCVFLNGHFAIQGGFKRGTVSILNNVFVANKMAAVEVYGLGGKKGPRGPIEKDGHVEIRGNTILFTWSRLKDFADMGYGIRVMTMVSYDIHENIIGGNLLAGIDHTRSNRNEWVRIDNNLFFMNKQAPLLYVEPGRSAAGKMERIKTGDMNEDLGLAGCRGNTDRVTHPIPVHKRYFEGFLQARYSEKENFDPDSPANVLREVMGLPKQGKLITQVNMFANRYPLPDALRLFGALPSYGAQMPR